MLEGKQRELEGQQQSVASLQQSNSSLEKELADLVSCKRNGFIRKWCDILIC